MMRNAAMTLVVLGVLALLAAWFVIALDERSDANDRAAIPAVDAGAPPAATIREGAESRIDKTQRTSTSALDDSTSSASVSPESARIRGRVSDATGNAIHGALIAIAGGATATSASDGRYEIASVAPGAVQLTATHHDWTRETLDLEISAGQIVDNADFILETGLALAGRVVDELGNPLAGAEVRAKWMKVDEALDRTASCDSAGRFRIVGLEPGVYLLSAHLEFHVMFQEENESVLAGRDDVELTLMHEATIAGVVIGPVGEPVAGAAIHVNRKQAAAIVNQSDRVSGLLLGSAPAPSTVSDANGRFQIRGLRPGTLRLSATCAGYLSSGTLELHVEAARSISDVALALREGATISGRVVTADGAPIDGAQVAASIARSGEMMFSSAGGVSMVRSSGRSPSQGGQGSTATSGADGAFTLNGLESGVEYSVMAKASGFAGAPRFESIVRRPPAAGLEIVLVAAGNVRGIVTDESKTPIDGANVNLSDGKLPRFEKTANDGSFAFTDVAPGSYTLGATHEEFGASPGAEIKVEVGVLERELVLLAGSMITGRVTDTEGEAVAGARITAIGTDRTKLGSASMLKATSNADGAFTLRGAQEFVYEISAKADGFVSPDGIGPVRFGVARGAGAPDGPRKGHARARPGDHVVLELDRGLMLTGLVVSARKEPLVSYSISVIGPPQPIFENLLQKLAVVDSDGRFECAGVDADAAKRIRITAKGHADLEFDLPPLAGREVVDLGTLAMTAGATISGSCHSPSGRPVEGVRVSIERKQEEKPEGGSPRMTMVSMAIPSTGGGLTGSAADANSVITGSDGRFSFEHVADGKYEVRGEHEGDPPATQIAEVKMGRDVDGLRLEFTEAGIIRGVVLDALGAPITGRRVTASARDSSMPVSSTQSGVTGDDGRYEIAGLAAGAYSVSTGGEGPAEFKRARNIELAAGAHAICDFTDPILVNVAGRVLDHKPSRSPTSSFTWFESDTLTLRPADPALGATGSARVEADGSFRISGVPPGDYRVAFRGGGSIDLTIPAVAEFLCELNFPKGSIAGRVTRADGQTVVGGSVRTQLQGSDTKSSYVPFGDDGIFEVRHLAAGVYTVTASIHEYGQATMTDIEVDAPVTNLELTVQPR